MDTSKMRCLEKMDSRKSYKLLQMAKDLARAATEVQGTLENSFLREQVLEVVEGYYDLGKVLDTYEIFGGYINRSFKVLIEEDGVVSSYFVRKYKLGITESEVLFEHAMITHALNNGFSLLAGVIKTRENRTFVSPEISRNKFAVYQYLNGEDKYTWDNPLMEDSEYKSAGEVLAAFHCASNGFNPDGLSRLEPQILDMMQQFPKDYQGYAEQYRKTKFHEYFCANLEEILTAIENNSITSADADQMLTGPIHCDYHPGNLKFEGGKVVGLFDFDWSKIDFRLFDVCLSLAYNSVQWGGSEDGTMYLEKCQLFLKSYQDTIVQIGTLQPLSTVELINLPTMMAMANFYLLNWDIQDYYSATDRNDYEYLAYLKHNVRQMRWIENHKEEFAELADSITLQSERRVHQ